ncbi:MAG TPA: DUF3592 domain-containing protein [Anaerolineales bacterium]|nr:DUF3592 domain-containing protein [Anaerolineales bacterium]
MVASIALGFIGLILLGIAFFLWTRTREFVAGARSAKATVVRLVSDSEGAVAPVFKFTASNGDVIEKHDGMYSNPPAYDVGHVVDILYDPSHPQSARIARTTSLYFAPILLAVLGVIFGGTGLVWLVLLLLDVVL